MICEVTLSQIGQKWKEKDGATVSEETKSQVVKKTTHHHMNSVLLRDKNQNIRKCKQRKKREKNQVKQISKLVAFSNMQQQQKCTNGGEKQEITDQVLKVIFESTMF